MKTRDKAKVVKIKDNYVILRKFGRYWYYFVQMFDDMEDAVRELHAGYEKVNGMVVVEEHGGKKYYVAYVNSYKTTFREAVKYAESLYGKLMEGLR